MKPRRRTGTTFVASFLVALGLMALVGAGVWSLYLGLNKRASRLSDYSSVLRGVAILRAQLHRDLRSVELGQAGATFSVNPEETQLSFSATLPQKDPAETSSPSPAQDIEWSLQPADDGTLRLRRVAGVEGEKVYDQLVLVSGRIRSEAVATDVQVVVLEASVQVPPGPNGITRSIPLKVSQKAVPVPNFDFPSGGLFSNGPDNRPPGFEPFPGIDIELRGPGL